MRPINLIPKGESGGKRGGPLAYILIGGLVVLLAGVALLVTTNNQISSGKAEIVELKAEDAAAQAKASTLVAYTQLREVHDQRVATVTSLAESRFDWERVLNELALVIPGDISLTNLTGTVSPQVSATGAASVGLRTATAGPALEMEGCAGGQEAVASFITALKDIDGVTRVGMQSSALGDSEGEAGGVTTDSAPSSGSSDCPASASVAKFQVVVAFDAAPVPVVALGEGE